MKVGIPRAGLYYVYYPFWKTFLETLGFEVVLSDPTDRALLEEGLKIANSEMCLPMKVMYGHIVALKDKVDAICLPQMDEAKWGAGKLGTSTYFCPYFVGLADVMRSEFPETEFWQPLMSFQDNEIEAEPWLEFAGRHGIDDTTAKRAFQKAKQTQQKYIQAQVTKQRTPLELLESKKIVQPKDGRTIGLVGRPYLVYDEQANLNLIGKLNQRGFKVRTMEMLPKSELKKGEKRLSWNRRSHWLLTNEEYGAIFHLGDQSDVAGIIYVIPFNCGPDFVLEDFVIRQVRKQKPISVISIDESTGEAGLTTRVDAFLDMIPK